MNITIPVRKAGRSINVDTAKLVNVNESVVSAIQEFKDGEGNYVILFDAILNASKSITYALSYGLTQSLNDSHAADTKKTNATPDSIMGTVQKKLDAIYAGTIKTKGSAAASGNPVEREATKLARRWWKAKGVAAQNAAIGKTRGAHEKLTDVEDEKIADLIVNTYAKMADIVAKAEAIVAANNLKVEDVEIDLADLMDEESDESDEDDSDESDESEEE